MNKIVGDEGGGRREEKYKQNRGRNPEVDTVGEEEKPIIEL